MDGEYADKRRDARDRSALLQGLAKRRSRARFLLRALCVLALLVAAVPASSSGAEVRLLRNATSAFDPFITDPSPESQAWMRDHYSQMRGYSPYFDNQGLPWSPPPTSFYRDLYAIYNNSGGNQLIAQHPDWVLRDGAGRQLYIPYACSGGTCPQYAGDIGNPAFRANWIAEARSTFNYAAQRSPDGSGYAGVFIDDVNLEMKVGNGNSDLVAPIDPRTGGTMTQQNWQRYMARFVEEIRAAFPDAQITHNPIWWLPHSDPEVRRQIAAADVIELERGFNDAGLTGGGGKYGYNTFLAHVAWLHRRGKAVVLAPYLQSEAQARYELANYLLARRRGDRILSDFRADPPVDGGTWWARWNTNPGHARGGARKKGSGLWRRNFGRGTAIVNPPGAAPRTVRFKRPRKSLSGEVSRRFRLGPREGEFFRKLHRR